MNNASINIVEDACSMGLDRTAGALLVIHEPLRCCRPGSSPTLVRLEPALQFWPGASVILATVMAKTVTVAIVGYPGCSAWITAGLLELFAIANNARVTLGELFAELSRESAMLIRQEVMLARVELTQKAAAFARRASLIVVGGAIAYAGALVVLAALVLVLMRAGLPAWGAALLLGGITVITGGIMTRIALSALTSPDLRPVETIRTMKENAEWVKQATK